MKLINDVVSSLNPKKVYGRAGDEVTIISADFDKQTIVEDANGDRFSTMKSNLTEGFVQGTAKSNVNNNERVQVSKPRNSAKAVPLNQQSLF